MNGLTDAFIKSTHWLIRVSGVPLGSFNNVGWYFRYCIHVFKAPMDILSRIQKWAKGSIWEHVLNKISASREANILYIALKQ